MQCGGRAFQDEDSRMCLAIPGKIVSIEESADSRLLGRMAKVSFGGIVRQVHLGLVPDASVGDYVMVHVGFAISKVDAQEAERTLAYLQSIEEVSENEE